VPAVEPPGRLPSYVQAALGIDSQRGQQAEHATDPELGEVCQSRAEVGTADGRQAEDPPLPGRICEKPARVEAPHTVTDHVHGLIGKYLEDLRTQVASALFDASNRGHSRDEDAVSRCGEELGYGAKVRREREAADANSRKAEEAVRQNDGRAQARNPDMGQNRGCGFDTTIPASAAMAPTTKNRIARPVSHSLHKYATQMTFCEPARHDGMAERLFDCRL
jgi:hypothetical protein